MTSIEEAHELINNLDWREATRSFAPEWAIVVVDEQLRIVAVKRFKHKPEAHEVDSLMSGFPMCAYFYTQPGMYPSHESLRRKVDRCAEAFSIDWERNQTGQARIESA